MFNRCMPAKKHKNTHTHTHTHPGAAGLRSGPEPRGSNPSIGASQARSEDCHARPVGFTPRILEGSVGLTKCSSLKWWDSGSKRRASPPPGTHVILPPLYVAYKIGTV